MPLLWVPGVPFASLLEYQAEMNHQCSVGLLLIRVLQHPRIHFTLILKRAGIT